VSDPTPEPPAGGSFSRTAPGEKAEATPWRAYARRSTLTALANALFGVSVLSLLVGMYRQGSYRSPWVLVAGILLVGAIAGWAAAARWGAVEEDADRSNRSNSN
jgi:hypothetical protein